MTARRAGFHELDVEMENRVGRNRTLSTATVAFLGRNGELPLLPDAHPINPLLPTLDHHAQAKLELDRLAPLVARIKLGAISERTDVVNLQGERRRRRRSGPREKKNFQFLRFLMMIMFLTSTILPT